MHVLLVVVVGDVTKQNEHQNYSFDVNENTDQYLIVLLFFFFFFDGFDTLGGASVCWKGCGVMAVGKIKLTYFLFTFQSFCLDHRRVPSKDNQLNFSLIGNHRIQPTNTRSNTMI